MARKEAVPLRRDCDGVSRTVGADHGPVVVHDHRSLIHRNVGDRQVHEAGNGSVGVSLFRRIPLKPHKGRISAARACRAVDQRAAVVRTGAGEIVLTVR